MSENVLRSLRSRLFLTYLIFAGVILTSVVVGLIYVVISNVERLELRRLNVFRDAFEVREANVLSDLPAEGLARFLERVDEGADIRLLVLDAKGNVIADSRSEARALPEGVRERVVQSATNESGRFGGVLSASWLYVSSTIPRNRWLILSTPVSSLKRLSTWMQELTQPLLRTGVLTLLTSALLAWLIARWVAAPWGRAASAARAVAAGDYERQMEPIGPVEAESMAVAFNEMVRRVQSSRLAQRDFVANVSHELKTPLTSIQGFAQAIIDGTAEDGDQVERAAQVIFDESDRLRRLVEDLLDLARMDAGQVDFERRPVDLVALVRSVQDRLEIRAEDHEVELINQVPSLPTIVGDGDRLAQVFTNLIDNAIHHTSKGGRVALRADVQTGWVSIHVDDEGAGIPAEELSRIFERFYQLDKSRSAGKRHGAGLGLAISKEIVQVHGGRLVAQSTIGRGSRFTVQLPIVRPDDKTIAHRRQE